MLNSADMETSRRDQRIGYAVGILLAFVMAGWLALISYGAMEMAAASPSPSERGDVNW